VRGSFKFIVQMAVAAVPIARLCLVHSSAKQGTAS
jgi:hypothetical protein